MSQIVCISKWYITNITTVSFTADNNFKLNVAYKLDAIRNLAII